MHLADDFLIQIEAVDTIVSDIISGYNAVKKKALDFINEANNEKYNDKWQVADLIYSL
jgi:hypothetical protein